MAKKVIVKAEIYNLRLHLQAKKEGMQKKYYLSGDISAEIQYTNDKTNGAVKVYYKEKSLSRKQMHKIESLLVENALATKLLRVCILRD